MNLLHGGLRAEPLKLKLNGSMIVFRRSSAYYIRLADVVVVVPMACTLSASSR